MPRVEAAEEADAALWEQVIIDQATYEKQVKEGGRKGIEQNARMHCSREGVGRLSATFAGFVMASAD
jgi:hypothetical protein